MYHDLCLSARLERVEEGRDNSIELRDLTLLILLQINLGEKQNVLLYDEDSKLLW